MPTATIKYLGELRTQCTHNQSGTKIITDAPSDNQGKGEAFSPTDLLSTSLVACMVTLMGIAARTHKIDLGEIHADMDKIMFSEPRRVGKINIKMCFLNGSKFDDKTKQILIKSAMTCPVYHSLHPDIEKNIEWIWQ